MDVQRGSTTFLLSFSFLYLSLLLLASVFLPLYLFYFFYFSTFSRQFVAGEDLRVAGDIAGRRRFLTTLYIVHLKLLLCENSSYLNYFQL